MISSIIVTYAGEFLALTGARLNGKELVAAGLATHFVQSEVRFRARLKQYLVVHHRYVVDWSKLPIN
jgi:enoyl-CoA hydratase/carnithine racemase